jgi:hypothetical protein
MQCEIETAPLDKISCDKMKNNKRILEKNIFFRKLPVTVTGTCDLEVGFRML